MTIVCQFELVAPLCAGLVRLGIQFTCREGLTGEWHITMTGGY